MSRRARKKEEGKEQSTASITSFLYGAEEKPKAETKPITKPAEVKAAEAKVTEKATPPQQSPGVEDMVLSHIMSRGGVITKDELMAWGKSRVLGLLISSGL